MKDWKSIYRTLGGFDWVSTASILAIEKNFESQIIYTSIEILACTEDKMNQEKAWTYYT